MIPRSATLLLHVSDDVTDRQVAARLHLILRQAIPPEAWGCDLDSLEVHVRTIVPAEDAWMRREVFGQAREGEA